MTPLHVEIPYSLGKPYWISFPYYLLGWGLVRSIEKGSSFETAIWFPWFSLNFAGKKKFLPHKHNHYLLSGKVSTEQGSSKSTSLLPKPTADQASLVTTWLSVSLLKLLAMATGDVWTKPMQRPVKNVALFPYQCNCLCWKIAMGRLHWILLCWMWQVPLAWPWESDSHGAPSCVSLRFCVPSENGVTRWGCCSIQCWAEIVCIGVVMAIVLAHRSLIKTKSRSAKLRQVGCGK